jgi:hypothetical protein
MSGVWPLAVTWGLLILMLIIVHKVQKPHAAAAGSIRVQIFGLEVVILSLLFFAFTIIELDTIRRGQHPQSFVIDALELLGAFVASLLIYKVFSRSE